MIRILAALAFFLLALGLAAPASAQITVVPPDQQRAAVAHAGVAVAAGQRITAILMPLMENPELAAARTPEQLLDVLTRMLPQIAAGRQELQAIEQELSALPTLAGPDVHPEIAMVDNAVANMIRVASHADGVLADHAELADALRKRDYERVEALVQSLVKASVVIMESQAVSMRGQLPLMGSDSSQYAILSGMACFYEGAAALQRGAYGMVSRAEATRQLATAQQCIEEQIETGRRNLAIEAATPPPHPALRQMHSQIIPAMEAFLDHLVSAADIMADARISMMEGWSQERLFAVYNPRVLEFQLGLQPLQRRILEVNQTQGR
ncbi:hypothetical protein [Brevundimonas poindexterae]|uniref:hypothetical protein n=1 Tax=Brevundimonas poindexterae TaxID=74325 RepID=UPI001CFD6A86|nr:hypothetical protein [Brevundimonas poindexterae]